MLYWSMEIEWKLVPKGKRPVVSAGNLAILLGISESTVRSWSTRYDIKKHGSRFVLKSALEHVIGMQDSGKAKNKDTKERAQAILDYLEEGSNIKPPEPAILLEGMGERLILTEELGIEASLERLRKTEVYLSKQVAASAGNPGLLKISMKNWQESLELLRKIEADTLKVLEQQRILIRVDAAMSLYNKGIAPTQTKMRALPRALSQDLVGLDAEEIEEILEKEIDRALEGIANIWENEDD